MKTYATTNLSFPVETKRAAKYFTSWCPALEIISYGETKEMAEECLKKVIKIFLTYCYERGALEKVLKECSLTVSKSSLSEKPKSSLHEIDITLPFIINQ